ncbi:MAG: hypothetical protein N3C12_05145 [Candidatus Binatia bacterium]|nr:hypothetical protein [Candidatus Binatia bacterium]
MRTLPSRFLLLLVLIGVVAGAVMWQRIREQNASSSPSVREAVRTVAVFPLVPADDESRAVASGTALLLAHRLSGNGPWRRIPGQCLLPATGAPVVWDAHTARQRALELGAAAFVLGRVRVAQGQVEAEVQWYDVTDPVPRAAARASGALRRLAGVVDRLAEELEAGRVATEQIRIARVAAVTSDSFPALLAYFRAEEHLQEGNLPAAEEQLDSAVAEDPQFALAYYRLAEVARRLGHSERAAQARQNALLLSNRLPVQERTLSDLLVLRLRQQTAEAEQGYRELVQQQPSEWEAWCALAELAKRRGEVARSEEALRRVRQLLPSQSDACGAGTQD